MTEAQGLTADPADHAALARHGEQSINQGSKSFAMASRFFGETMRADVQMLYAWCRYCDDVIDGQSMGEDAPDISLSTEEQARRLADLQEKTRLVYAGKALNIPAFDGFRQVVERHDLPQAYPQHLLEGFAMDVGPRQYATLDDTMQYCYGVAGCVGIMMALIMGVDRNDGDTLDRACDLGLAFQLTNISRDVIDDAKAGRLYLPTDILQRHGLEPTTQDVLALSNRRALHNAVAEILTIADQYYGSATKGIRRLPMRAGTAIAAARNIYRQIGKLIVQRGENAWDQRVFTSKTSKVLLGLGGIGEGAWHRILLQNRPMPARPDLWVRPGV